MILSQLSNLSEYIEPSVYEHIAVFLAQVNEKMPEGEYPILGEKAFARVMSYNTVIPENCEIEAHNKYIDIQATIMGAEGISVYNRKNLTESIPYNSEKDVVFFRTQEAEEIAHTVNLPGYFTMLFPEDAHRPKERAAGFEKVKKFVIKIAVK